MDLSTALSVSWPIILVCILAIGALGWAMKSANAALRESMQQLAGTQAQLNRQIAELDQQFKQAGNGQAALVERLANCERTLQQQAAAPAASQPEARATGDGDVIEVPADSMQRFEAASQALAQLAQELGGLDARQAENWQRIKGDLEEQGFHLQRVQQHVDRLFADDGAQSAEPAAVSPA